VIEAFELPDRTCAAEIYMSVVETAAAAQDLPQADAPLSAFPFAAQDVALLVPVAVAAQDVADALVAGAQGASGGSLLEDIRLFDVYTGEQAGEGRKSLAYTLRFRAADRTLTAEEASAARDAAVAEAGRRTGAVLRGGA
jgi:phenylalanyl-tRNA synthetase beta chain